MERLEYRSYHCPAYVAPRQFHHIHAELAPVENQA
jgi:hypothetical protein